MLILIPKFRSQTIGTLDLNVKKITLYTTSNDIVFFKFRWGVHILRRRTIKNSKTTLELLEIKKKMKSWCKNLNDVPAIGDYDIMILYLCKSCHGDERRPRIKKKSAILNTGYIKPIISSMLKSRS